MVTKKLITRTRPFQPFILAGNDLLQLALPYHQQIQARKDRYAETKVIDTSGRDEWQLEKSLSIGSFMVKYAGLEALVNCTFEDHMVREVKDLSDDYFIGPLLKKQSKLQGKKFTYWHLATRVFLIIPLCSDPEMDPRTVLDTTSDEWKKFEEIIKIRHSFNHGSEVVGTQNATKLASKLWITDDNYPENFWPLTKVYRDHRLFGYEDALNLHNTIDSLIQKLRAAMPTQLDDKYMTTEQWKQCDV